MEFVETSKGGLKLCLEGHQYTKKKETNVRIWWQCVRRTRGCRGSLSTDLARDDPRAGQVHDHEGDNDGVEIAKVRQNMKRRAAETRDKPCQILVEATAACNVAVRARLPDAESCKRSLRNQRPKQPAPQHIEEMGEIPVDLQTTTTGRPFIIYDNGPFRHDRILAFATEQGIAELARADQWFMDGNFSMAPGVFTQIYFIRIQVGTTTITPVYALLTNKRQQTYEELFRAVLAKADDLNFNLNLRRVVTDFEDAVLRAVASVFGRDIRSSGCFYHLTQSTWRRIQELGLTNVYRESEEFKLFVGMMDGLAFLPLDDIPAGMRVLRNLVPDGAEDLLDYFDATYVSGRFRPRQDGNALLLRRAPPMFPAVLWNQHNATVNGDPRTNNICESFNQRFKQLVGHYHPDVWRCIQWFRLEESSDYTILAQNAVGEAPTKRVRQDYIRMQERLRTLCLDRANNRKTVEEFLRGVGHNIRLEARY